MLAGRRVGTLGEVAAQVGLVLPTPAVDMTGRRWADVDALASGVMEEGWETSGN